MGPIYNRSIPIGNNLGPRARTVTDRYQPPKESDNVTDRYHCELQRQSPLANVFVIDDSASA
jgi:hypothetical protein